MSVASAIVPRAASDAINGARRGGQGMIVGKDILELLSTAMYVDPLTLFREYVQNAADAIDEAFRDGLLTGRHQGDVRITFDHEQRRVTIRDNGAGLPSDQVDRLLTSFGASKKRGSTARGFRGVGRLAGLGYCQTLRFRTKTADERRVLVVEWDCRKLRHILLDTHYEGDLRQVVGDVVVLTEVDATGFPPHFFEVEMEKVVRIRNDVLLNPEAVASYLRQAAPLPFSKDFTFGKEIEVFLGQHVPSPRFRLYVGDGGEPLTRPIGDRFPISLGKTGRFESLEVLKFESQDGELAALGWLLHHGYVGSLRHAPEIRGLRARMGGIQVGGPDLFAQVFPEERFSSWTVGEIHILDRRIVPNGRRDDFEQNPAFFHLLNQVAPIGRAIANRCRASSIVRTRLKTFGTLQEQADELLKILKGGHVGNSTRRAMAREVGDLLEKLRKISELEVIPAGQRGSLQRRVKQLVKRQTQLRERKAGSSVLRSIPKGKRATFSEAFDLIYECSRNRLAAKALVDRMTARLRGMYR